MISINDWKTIYSKVFQFYLPPNTLDINIKYKVNNNTFEFNSLHDFMLFVCSNANSLDYENIKYTLINEYNEYKKLLQFIKDINNKIKNKEP